ncbi:DUF3558 family protein [Amycolatopsis azurea]|uniref:DUF3558 family protein n=1 Tax=Amycolatopsis azurea TaxID=36819 RepID=UPI003817A0D7
MQTEEATILNSFTETTRLPGKAQAFKSRLPSALLVIASVSTLAACAAEGKSISTPAPISTLNEQEPNEPAKGVFGNLDACGLLREATASFGYKEYKPESLESDNGCRAEQQRHGNIALYLVEQVGVDDIKPGRGTVVPTQIGGRKAVEVASVGGEGSCFIGLAVMDTSRATVNLTLSTGSTTEACTEAKTIAEQIAPKLPRGN